MPDRDKDETVPAGAPGSAQEQDHEPTGLDAARAVAARYRSGQQRPRVKGSSRPAREAHVSGAHPDGRDPALLGASVDKLVNESGWTTDVAVRGVFARWPRIVGDEVAGHCTPQSFEEGKLIVGTDSTAWATQLKLLAPTVVRRLNEELGHGTISQIVVHGPDTLSWRRGRRAVRDGRGPRDTYG
ncbi:MAG: DciA family protein [Nocardioidaceae bacterium]